MYRCCALCLAALHLLHSVQERERKRRAYTCMHERESETSVATGVVLADGDDPVCVYCSAAGTCSSIAGKSLSSPLHVTVRPAGGRGRDGEEKMHGERERERTRSKGNKRPKSYRERPACWLRAWTLSLQYVCCCRFPAGLLGPANRSSSCRSICSTASWSNGSTT